MILTLLARKEMKKTLDHRWDGNPNLPYYDPKDLSLEEEPFSFMDNGHRIDGSRYCIKDMKPKALVCFFHGIGAGRNAYMKEISLLCKEGYLVYAYDNLGCAYSEGIGIGSLGRPYETQRKFFEWLDKDERSQGLKRYAMGHSWGGYGAMIALKTEYKIEKSVSLAGFLRPSTIIFKRAKGHLKRAGLLPIRIANRLLGGKNSDIDARNIVRQSEGKLLYIVGDKDPLVPMSFNGEALKEEFDGSPRFSYMVIHGSGHQVHYTQQAEKYILELTEKGLTSINSPVGLHMDIDRATEMNMDVFKAIFDFLKD